MKTIYNNILKCDRRRPSTVSGDRSLIIEAESDRGRVTFSPAFRRLQQKAQVFSMEPNAAVRSRLTHSLEVAQTGRYIADQIVLKLKELGLADETECRALVNFVETACLMHDIGNPPFGHFGEAAIQKWFEVNGETLLKSALCKEATDKEKEQALADFHEFDGNPQGLRIVASLQWNNDAFGLNLTKTTLLSYLKYVRAPKLELSAEEKKVRFQKKPGFFSTEASLVADIWKDFGYQKAQRFPLANIMEAADDIAYCISDLEDSIEKGLLQEKTALKEISEACAFNKTSSDLSEQQLFTLFDDAKSAKLSYTDFRTRLSRILVTHAAQEYIENHDAILSGEFDSLIGENSACGKVLTVLKKFCRDNVYCHESVQRIELAGYTAISGLLNHFRELLSCSAARFEHALNGADRDDIEKRIVTEKKLLSLFPKRYKQVYTHRKKEGEKQEDEAVIEWNARAHLIVDFISGMTDDFAMSTYRTLSGMKL